MLPTESFPGPIAPLHLQPKVDLMLAALNEKLGEGYICGYSNSYSDSYAVELVITDALTGATTHIYRSVTSSIDEILNDEEYSLDDALEQLRYSDKSAHTLALLNQLTPDAITVRQSLNGDQWWAVFEFKNTATGATCDAEFDLDPAVENSAELPAIAAEATAALS